MNTKRFFKKQNFTPVMQLLGSIALIIFGIITLKMGIFWNLFYLYALIFIGFDVITRMLSFISSGKSKYEWIKLPFVLGELTVIVILVIRSVWFKQFLTMMFGIWIIFNALCRFFAFVIANKDRLSIRVGLFLDGLISLVFGFILLSNWSKTTYLVNNLIGFYLIIFGLIQALNAVNALSNDVIKKSFRFPIPVFLAAILPSMVVKTVNELVSYDSSVLSSMKESGAYGNKVSINFYIKERGHERFGHVDIGWQGKVYSYGCHDPFHRMKFQLFGEGVLIVANQEAFIDYEVNHRDKVLVQFICDLNEYQSTAFQAGLDKLMSSTFVFNYPYGPKENKEYYLSRLQDNGVELMAYKFRSGLFKTYFVITTNCVLLVEVLFQNTGINLFNFNGIVTPGTYYDVLDNAYNQSNSFVTEKRIYKLERKK